MNRRTWSTLLWLAVLVFLLLTWAPILGTGAVVITPDLSTLLNMLIILLTGLLLLVTIQWPYRLPFALRRGAILGALWLVANAIYVIAFSLNWMDIFGALISAAITGGLAFGLGPVSGWFNHRKLAQPPDRELSDEEIAAAEKTLAGLLRQLDKVRGKAAPGVQAQAWLAVGQAQARLSEWERAVESFDQAVAQAKQTSSRARQLVALSALALAQLRDRPDRALASFREMLALSPVKNRLLRGLYWLIGWPYQGAQIISMVNVGAACDRARLPDQALEVLEPAEALAKRFGYLTARTYALNNIGSAIEQTDPARAISYYRESLRLAGGLAGDAAARIIATANLAEAHRRLGEFEVAFERLEEAQAMVRRFKSRQMEAAVLRELGKVYADAGQPGHALAIFERALSVARATNHFSLEAALLKLGARVCSKANRTPEAVGALQQAITILETRDLPADFEGDAVESLRAELAALQSN